MARSNNNATNGIRGRVDQLVWKTRTGTGKTFASKVPDMSKVVPSEAQIKCRLMFKLAARMAKAKLKIPGMKEYYLVKAMPGQSAYIVAWKEFYHALKNGDDVEALFNAKPVQPASDAAKENSCCSNAAEPMMPMSLPIFHSSAPVTYNVVKHY